MTDMAALWAEQQASRAPAEFQPGNLEAKFVAPPFTVLDTRQGYWQDRRRAWLSLGIKSELGRGADLLSLSPAEGARARWSEALPASTTGHGMSAQLGASVAATAMRSGEGRELVPGKGNARSDFGAYTTDEEQGAQGGTSIFDPVLCELMYRWFAPEGGLVLDPFAGGSVRGIVAAKLGHPYTGVDLSLPQLEANRQQAQALLAPSEPHPTWLHGDSVHLEDLLPAGQMYDMVMTCPPYFDLEVYSNDPADLSNAADYGHFLEGYFAVVARAAARLLPERFMVLVVSEIRDQDGYCHGLVPDTVRAAQLAGLHLYNEAVLVNSAGSLPLRVTKYMESSRKLGRAHQNVLVFVKGKPPRGWSYDRAAPPSPQLSLALEPEPAADIAPPPPALVPAAAPEPEAEPVGAAPLPERQRASVALTEVQATHTGWVKRDDTFEVAGVRGGKVRTCWQLAQGATGLVTAGSRSSPQVNIVAHVAAALGVPCRVHTPEGELSPEVQAAVAAGAEVVQHRAGYNNVIIARAREDAAASGWREIPFGMECAEAVALTAEQVANVPPEARRIVVPVGSGMSLAGILHGLVAEGRNVPVLGVMVGADPTKRLDRWAPPDWRERVRLVPSGTDYHEPALATTLPTVAGAITLDAHYEAKAAPYLEPGDLLWAVGIRASQERLPEEGSLEWVADVEGLPEPTVWEEAEADALALRLEALPEDVPFNGGHTVFADGEPVADPETGEVLGVAPAEPSRDWWHEHRAELWQATDPKRACWECGRLPDGRFSDGSPKYDCVHPVVVHGQVGMF